MTGSEDQPLDVSSVSDEAADELLRQASECLAGTLQLAVAADQRGATMTGIFGAGSVALLAGAVTVTESKVTFLAFLLTAVVLFAATLICAWSVRPVDFFVGGYEPRLLLPSATDVGWMKRYASIDMQRRISGNRRALERASTAFKAGVVVAGLSPFVGIAVYLLSAYLVSTG